MERVKCGDKAAFEVLLIASQNDVYALALKMLGNQDDALDVSQDAFLRAYTAIGKFRADARFSVWMYRITYNICLDRLRKTRRRSETSLESEEGEPELQIPDLSPLPEERAVSRETAKLVRAGLDSLPPKLRAALVMREVNELSYAEIAASTGAREGTVKSRISRARAALAEYLRSNGTFIDDNRHNGEEGGDSDA
ncbi:MAG: sigma-70 family RNA polymerase sigma factor [Oscillospiraceae bacterium]|nr:sigma-70 family RNA polymerase sigma factor [Oscillospiraceae bacterium]